MLDSLLGLLAALTFVSPAHAAPPMFGGVTRVASAPLPTAKDAPVKVAVAPKKLRPNSMGVSTTVRSAFVADVATGSVLFAKRPHDVLPIASLTKIMTAMVVLDAKLDMDEQLTFTEEDLATESKDVFAVGDTITRRDALKALMIGSVNEAGNLLARTSFGREKFIQAMNDKAKILRLASPIFVDPTGLDAGNRASAADVAALMSISMSYPELREISAMPTVVVRTAEGKDVLVKSTNLLLTSFLNKAPHKIVGAKTGSLPQAGYSMAQLTRNGGHEIVVVGLGSPNHFSRYQDIKAMTAWAFETFGWE